MEMEANESSENINEQIKALNARLSEQQFQLEESKAALEEEQNQRQFYQLISDFTFGWEIWIDPGGKLKYCSPSCFDLTGFTANQVISSGIGELLVYGPDRDKFEGFIDKALDQLIINKSLEFRVLTRHKQLIWCSVNMRGVYNKTGRYLGIRASIHDITRLKKAMGHIHEMSTEKEMEQRAKMRFKTELDVKERELISFLLELSKKNELIAMTTSHLKKMESDAPKKHLQKITDLLKVLERASGNPVDWDMVVMQLEKLHPGFLDRLLLKHPNLTPKEKKLCAYIKLELSSKEIAGLQNVTPQSVEIARVRLRKKIRIPQKTRLSKYIELV